MTAWCGTVHNIILMFMVSTCAYGSNTILFHCSGWITAKYFFDVTNFDLGIFTTASDIENLSAEILKMRKFNHPNVMKLIGVCIVPSDQDVHTTGPCIVMPFMAKGSLLDTLRKEADNLITTNVDDPNVS